ncbi:alpha/beta hydrolase [Pelagibacteraceae bacterium]|nr:alpha/beta hydrolase [Pelagibacteraceae bacterium]
MKLDQNPKWFQDVLTQKPKICSAKINGTKIIYNVWGDKRNPGLIFIHGGMAHADWWNFIGPYFAKSHRVIAMNLGGMGDSDWKKTYSIESWGNEIVGVCKKEKLKKPILVGHSLGGMCSVIAASLMKKSLYGLIIVDTAIMPPSDKPPKFDLKIRANNVYKNRSEIKNRFRLVPSQSDALGYIMDYIAERSIKRVRGGWTWKFDPNYMRIFNSDSFAERQTMYRNKLKGLKCRVAIFRGEKSVLFPGRSAKYMHALMDKKSPIINIPEAHHHIMVDQPLALVAALRSLVIDWDHSKPSKAL